MRTTRVGRPAFILPPPSQWTVDSPKDRQPTDPTQAELRRRIDQVWKLKAVNGGAFPLTEESHECSQWRNRLAILRLILSTLPMDGREIRHCDFLRTAKWSLPSPDGLRSAMRRLEAAGVIGIRTNAPGERAGTWYRLVSRDGASNGLLKSLARESFWRNAEAAA